MRQYVVDELRPKEVEKIREYLDENCDLSDIEGLYWLKIPDDILSPAQYEHKSCQPHCVAIELGDKWVKFEMLVRSRQKIRWIRCKCVSFATHQQRAFLLSFVDNLLDRTGIRI
ncbi:MAG: hypothetical protein JRI48_03605 [Deltaproteobacteria bacterium]|nr:hypothetical protein [Deltaproteobacteria bacterium]